MRREASVEIAATPEVVYDLVSDVTRMGQWSPETIAAEWIPPADGPAVGARFRGRNKRFGFVTWSTKPTVVAADRGVEFAFDTGATVWRYTFAPIEGGTRVTESFETHGDGARIDWLYRALRRDRNLVAGMTTTLARLKDAAERDAGSG
ncbi:MAG: SRPBCC family protein [Acidimicrobiia bacterium]|nr:SRPBCC family protein [Acidimicrobiia bacterium]